VRDRNRCWLAALLAIGALAVTSGAQGRLMRFADVHQDRIVFTYEGDLWLVDAVAGWPR